jgi:hypothetical protein
MKIKRYHTLLVCFLLISNFVVCQQNDDPPLASSEFLFPQFTDGVITLKDGTVCNLKINYNTLSDQMQFMNPNKEVLDIAEPEKIVKVVIANRNFIYIRNNFVELLTDGTVSLCLRVHEKRYAEKIGAYGGTSPASSIQSLSTYRSDDGLSANLSANEKVSFQTEFVFYVMYNGKMKMVLNQNDLLKCFPSNKALLKQELEKQHTKFQSIDSMKKIVEWINANGIKD